MNLIGSSSSIDEAFFSPCSLLPTKSQAFNREQTKLNMACIQTFHHTFLERLRSRQIKANIQSRRTLALSQNVHIRDAQTSLTIWFFRKKRCTSSPRPIKSFLISKIRCSFALCSVYPYRFSSWLRSSKTNMLMKYEGKWIEENICANRIMYHKTHLPFSSLFSLHISSFDSILTMTV